MDTVKFYLARIILLVILLASWFIWLRGNTIQEMPYNNIDGIAILICYFISANEIK